MPKTYALFTAIRPKYGREFHSAEILPTSQAEAEIIFINEYCAF